MSQWQIHEIDENKVEIQLRRNLSYKRGNKVEIDEMKLTSTSHNCGGLAVEEDL